MMAFKVDIRQTYNLFLTSDSELDECKVAQVGHTIIPSFPLVWLIRIIPGPRCMTPSIIIVIMPFSMLTRQRQDMEGITLILHVGHYYTARIAGRYRWM